MRLNSISQCCSSVSPTILVDSFAFMSRSRSMASSRSLICCSYFSCNAFSPSAFCASASSRSALSRSRSFSTRAVASITASCFDCSDAWMLAFSFSTSAAFSASWSCSVAANLASANSTADVVSALACSSSLSSFARSASACACASFSSFFLSRSASSSRSCNCFSKSPSRTCFRMSAYPASSIVKALPQFGQMISCIVVGPSSASRSTAASNGPRSYHPRIRSYSSGVT